MRLNCTLCPQFYLLTAAAFTQGQTRTHKADSRTSDVSLQASHIRSAACVLSDLAGEWSIPLRIANTRLLHPISERNALTPPENTYVFTRDLLKQVSAHLWDTKNHYTTAISKIATICTKVLKELHKYLWDAWFWFVDCSTLPDCFKIITCSSHMIIK